VSTGGQEAGRTADETLIHEGDLEEVFRQGSCLEVVVVSFADTTQERHWPRPSELELQHAKHETLSLEDLFDGVATVDHVNNLLNRRAVYFFVLRRDEQSSGTDQLKFAEGDDLAGQESVDEVRAEKESFWQKPEAVMNLDKPIHEDGAHGPLNLSLTFHVVRVGSQFGL